MIKLCCSPKDIKCPCRQPNASGKACIDELPDKAATNRWLTGKDSSLLRSHCIYDRDESRCKS